jgi:hypothetical protein
MNTEHQNWQVETATSSRSEDIEYFIRRDGDSVAVASDIINPETEQPSKEIADLLCAAPDLLEALKAMVSVYAGQVQNDGSYTVIDASARTAIAKAEGKA